MILFQAIVERNGAMVSINDIKRLSMIHTTFNKTNFYHIFAICSFLLPLLECQYMEFQCNSGECFPDYYKCDGRDDCSDKSDEQSCGM